MEMLEISFERQWEYDKDVHHFQHYLLYYGEGHAEDSNSCELIGG